MRALLVTMSVTLVACAQANPENRDPVAEVRAADTSISQAVSAKNLEGIIAHYSDDAILLPAAEPMIKGKAAIREEWEHILAIPDFSSQTETLDTKVSGDLGYTYGTYRARMMGEDGKAVEEPGKFVTIWRRHSDGKWRIVVDTYNTDVPPPDHK
ncbi:MAG: YybH family protein [Alphaproteobacteria bacterium]